MSNTAIAFGGQKHHLRFPAVRIERPTVAEHHRLSYTPILVINLRTIFHNDCAHNLPLFLSARVVGLSCPSYGSPPDYYTSFNNSKNMLLFSYFLQHSQLLSNKIQRDFTAARSRFLNKN